MEKAPQLNDARISMFGGYRALYDIRVVNEEKSVWVWKGRPIIEAHHEKIPGLKQAMEREWIFFSRFYDDRNDWDRLYREVEFDEELIGQAFILVPKEKLLFAFDPPPEAGIVLPPPGMNFGGRN